MSEAVVSNLVEAVRKAAQAGQRTVVQHNGDHAAVVSLDDRKTLEELEALEDARDSAEALASLAEGPAVPYEGLLADLPEDRAARIEAIKGRFAHVMTSSEEFALRKQEEIDREDARWRR